MLIGTRLRGSLRFEREHIAQASRIIGIEL